MNKIKPANVLAVIFCGGVLLIAAVFLVISLYFDGGSAAPELFGKRVYIVRTNNFSLVKEGEAVIAVSAAPPEIKEGHIVIFKNDKDEYGLAAITAVDLTNGIYSFGGVGESGAEITLSEGQIISRVTERSMALGMFIRFAKSPAGVFVLAFLPCAGIIVHEIRRAVKDGSYSREYVRAVNKLDEVPEYRAKLLADYYDEEPEEHTEHDTEFDDIAQLPGTDNMPPKMISKADTVIPKRKNAYNSPSGQSKTRALPNPVFDNDDADSPLFTPPKRPQLDYTSVEGMPRNAAALKKLEQTMMLAEKRLSSPSKPSKTTILPDITIPDTSGKTDLNGRKDSLTVMNDIEEKAKPIRDELEKRRPPPSAPEVRPRSKNKAATKPTNNTDTDAPTANDNENNNNTPPKTDMTEPLPTITARHKVPSAYAKNKVNTEDS
jgi:hypothetical protein